jgi:hypothetical protein
MYSSVQCTASCPTSTFGTARYQVCDPAANDCSSGTTCTASTALSGYSVCR